MRRIKPALGKATSRFPMLVVEGEAWSGDRMTFRVPTLGQVVPGTVDVADDHIRAGILLEKNNSGPRFAAAAPRRRVKNDRRLGPREVEQGSARYGLAGRIVGPVLVRVNLRKL